MKALTAEEFLKNFNEEENNIDKLYYDSYVKKAMIKFAKMHVQEALKQASENSFVEYIDLETNEKFDYTDVLIDDNISADVNKDSILNVYPLDLIK